MNELQQSSGGGLRDLRNIFGSVLASSLLASCLCAQIPVDVALINQYSGVRTVYHADDGDADSVHVTNPGIFHPGDTCLFYIAKGAEIYNPVEYPTLPVVWGKIMNMNNTGIYAFILVASVEDSIVVFTTSLPPMIRSVRSEVIQLIRLRTADRLIIDSPLVCKSWDPESGTGGILALIANFSITIAAPIDATGSGFVGGQPDTIPFGDTCKVVTEGSYHVPAADSAGKKGESIVYSEFPYTRGKGSNGTGGGGGNGRYSGGGGGSNFGMGGSGGKESEACSPGENHGGRSNYLNPGYFSNMSDFKNRIFMGGGGGTSTQDPPEAIATAGGNGGGILILITDSLITTHPDTLRANGQSVTDTATAGAGGGGGGGIIVIDADHYSGNLHLQVKGGNGGYTNNPTLVNGPGGLGGAGMLWFAGEYLPQGVSIDTMDGLPGTHVPTGEYRGATTIQTRNGSYMTGLISPLQGFLFNNIFTYHTVCSDEGDIVIYGSKPKGGDGTYTFHWEVSDDLVSWKKAPDTAKEKDYVTNSTSSGRYFRRIVTSGDITDTSRIVHFEHYPKISNNLIKGGGAICTDETVKPIEQDPPPLKGGTGTYAYLWEQFNPSSGWITIADKYEHPEYLPPLITDTTLYRRIVVSGDCRDTSNVIAFDIRQTLNITGQPVDDTIYPGEHAVFFVSCEGESPVSMQWYFSGIPVPGATDDTLLISQAGTMNAGDYFCRISNVCGELQSNTARLILLSTGIRQNPAFAPSIDIFPIPARDQLFIENHLAGTFTIHLYDLLGNRLGIWQEPRRIDISGFAQGIYLLRITDGSGKAVNIIRIEIAR